MSAIASASTNSSPASFALSTAAWLCSIDLREVARDPGQRREHEMNLCRKSGVVPRLFQALLTELDRHLEVLTDVCELPEDLGPIPSRREIGRKLLRGSRGCALGRPS